MLSMLSLLVILALLVAAGLWIWKGAHALYMVLTLLLWIFFSTNLSVDGMRDWAWKSFSVVMVLWALVEVLAAFGWVVRIGG
jgi:hypothetical protein